PNNAWPQELPKPFIKLTWDNAATMSIRTAEKISRKPLRDGDVIFIKYRGSELEAPVMLLPGMADDTIHLQLGYGRTHGGEVLTEEGNPRDRKSTRLNSSHLGISYAVFCLK